MCGGSWRISVFASGGAAPASTGVVAPSASATPDPTATASVPGTTVAPIVVSNIPQSSSDKLVVSQCVALSNAGRGLRLTFCYCSRSLIMGNTYVSAH